MTNTRRRCTIDWYQECGDHENPCPNGVYVSHRFRRFRAPGVLARRHLRLLARVGLHRGVRRSDPDTQRVSRCEQSGGAAPTHAGRPGRRDTAPAEAHHHRRVRVGVRDDRDQRVGLSLRLVDGARGRFGTGTRPCRGRPHHRDAGDHPERLRRSQCQGGVWPAAVVDGLVRVRPAPDVLRERDPDDRQPRLRSARTGVC